MEQSESDERNEPTEGVEENEEIHIEDQQGNNSNREPLLTMEVMDALLNNLEEKEKEIAMLKANEQVLNQQLQNSIEESNQLRIRLVQLSSENQQSNSNHQEESIPSNPLKLSPNEKELMEKNTNLNLSLLTIQKENSILKKKNLRLGELIMQRDAYITTLTKEKESLVGYQEQATVSQIEKEELQKTVRLLREEAIHHTSELQQEKAVSLALRQELTRIRQEKESIEHDYYRVENALQKNNDSLLSYQQQLSDSITRRNTLAQLLDDSKREIHLLENKVLEINEKYTKLQLNYQELELQKNHWESLTRSEIERSSLMKEEYAKLKEGYKDIYIYYMNMKSDNDRLQRQCEHLASDAELARASVLTYKGTLHKNDRSFDELLKENVYLSSMLKQKEGQLEEVEQYWKKQFKEVLQQEIKEEKPTPNPIPPFIPSPINNDKGGYSYPLPSNHPFISTPPNGLSTPQRTTIPNVPIMNPDSVKSTPTPSSLPTQSLSGISPISSVIQTSFTSTSFESLLNDVIKQTEELKKISDYYESQ